MFGKKNKEIFKILFSASVVGALFLCAGLMFTVHSSPVRNGMIDLTSYNFKSNGSVSLDGEWQFYWNRLLNPSDFEAEKIPVPDEYVTVPGSWTGTNTGKVRYPDMGCATYRAVITVNDQGLGLALRIRRIVNAYRVYVNGSLIAQKGMVSDRLSDYRPDYGFVTAPLPAGVSRIEIVIQVANLDYSRGGIRESIFIGSAEQIKADVITRTVIQIFCIGFVFAFGLFYLILFAIKKKDWASLFFSLLCLNIALRTAIWGEIPLQLIFPDMSLNASIMINYFTGITTYPLLFLFLANIYPAEILKKTVMLLMIPNLIYGFLLLTPPYFFSRYTDVLYILFVIYMICILIMLSKAVLKRRNDAPLMLFSVGTFFITTVSDALNIKGIGRIDSSYLQLFGTLLMVFVMSYIQSRQQESTYRMLKEAKRQLVEAEKLKDKIRDTEMAFFRAQIKPHFLFNALSAIATVSKKNGEKGSHLIIDLAMYLRQCFEFTETNKMSTIEKELEYVENYINIEKARFAEKIKYTQKIDVPGHTVIPIFLLQPLVENAVRHGISGRQSSGIVTLRIQETEEGIRVEVADDGVGMEQSKIKTILEGGDGKHVGLINIQSRLMLQYGRGLDIKSAPREGTIVRFTIDKEGEHNA